MTKEQSLVFYSWQSDLPNKTNRGFIENALKKAVKIIQDDESISTLPIIDRDTRGIPGAPDIASTIFGKIEQAQVFVCDISIINQDAIKDVNARPVPNPNVLIELGYALHALKDKRIIMLLNTAYGEPKLLPFDLYTRRANTYNMPENVEERASERNHLTDILTEALRTILNQLNKPLPGEPIQPPSLAEQAQTAIKTRSPEQTGRVQQYMNELANKIEEMNPKYASFEEERCTEQLRKAIDDSTGLVVEFSQLAETIASRDTDRAIKAMYKGFENILNLYTFSSDYQRQRHVFIPDFARFLGHELFVIFFSYLISYEKWEQIAENLDEDLYARTTDNEQFNMVSFHHLSETVRLFSSNQSMGWVKPKSAHASLLEERHTKSEIAKLVPIKQFAEADYLLYLRAQIQPDTVGRFPLWMPWSSLCIHQVPRYLQAAKRIKYTEPLLKALRVKDIQTLKTRLVERTGSVEIGWGYTPSRPWDNIIAGFDFSSIGTE